MSPCAVCPRLCLNAMRMRLKANYALVRPNVGKIKVRPFPHDVAYYATDSLTMQFKLSGLNVSGILLLL